jgi:hypothetical protein
LHFPSTSKAYELGSPLVILAWSKFFISNRIFILIELASTYTRLKRKILRKDNFCFLLSMSSRTFAKPPKWSKFPLKLPYNHKIMQIFTKIVCWWQKNIISLLYLRTKHKHCQYFEHLLKTSWMNYSH